jgi:predicted transcriptional regulator of viral defense system
MEKIISLAEATDRLMGLDCKGIQVFNRTDLALLFQCDSPSTLRKILLELQRADVIYRAARNVYVNCLAKSRKLYLIEEIANIIRREHFNYVSLESILSEFGVISQIMISRITIMTTGKSGIFNTKYGTIEFTHTKRDVNSLLARTLQMEGRPLRIATLRAGVADLRRVGRNTNMIDLEELNSNEF